MYTPRWVMSPTLAAFAGGLCLRGFGYLLTHALSKRRAEPQSRYGPLPLVETVNLGQCDPRHIQC
jgi:hypothetical protein